MKLSFSTRGWPGLSFDEMLETAVDMGFSGVEVYNLPNFDPLMEKGGPFHKYNTAATARQLREKGLSIPCFDTSLDISSDKSAKDTAIRLIEIARDAKVPYVVVCALTENEGAVYEALAALLPTAEAMDVTVLVKTSGIYSDTARLRAMLDRFASDRLAALIAGIATQQRLRLSTTMDAEAAVRLIFRSAAHNDLHPFGCALDRTK